MSDTLHLKIVCYDGNLDISFVIIFLIPSARFFSCFLVIGLSGYFNGYRNHSASTQYPKQNLNQYNISILKNERVGVACCTSIPSPSHELSAFGSQLTLPRSNLNSQNLLHTLPVFKLNQKKIKNRTCDCKKNVFHIWIVVYVPPTSSIILYLLSP